MSRHKLWISVDNYKRVIFLKYEIKRKLLKSIKYNVYIPLYKRYLALYFMSKLPRFSSSIYSNNRCVETGRVWHNHSKTNLSRFNLRTKIYQSNLPGFKRASW